ERVDDVTSHPAFKRAAQTVAQLYDLKHDPEFREELTTSENGEVFSSWFIRARNKNHLRKRMNAHKIIADQTCGMMGRSMDHVASFVTGMSTVPEVFDTSEYKFGRNLLSYYEYMKANDIFATYAVLPPQAARNPEFYQKKNLPIPTLMVVDQDKDGVTISGMKMLATSAVFCNDVWIGNLLPLAPDQVKQAITCAVPCNIQGLSMWMRQPISLNADNQFDSPLTWNMDETDVLIMCDNVKVPWEKVFVMDDALLAREIYIKTPGHCYGNHQANVRFWSKMELIVGLCSKITKATGADQVPAVRETLGRMAALEATLSGLIHGQIEAAESWPEGYMTFNRRMMYAALNWCTEGYSAIIDQLRELCGGGVFQMPASISVMHNEQLREDFMTYFQTPQLNAPDRMKLFKLAWDVVGSEFAGRQLQYEKFYAGASFIIRNHSFREAPWEYFDGVVDTLMDSYDIPV
ncbi:MAG: 4-hydroxyphenylacetate 3-hydroxylase N-terminal domain-containing protein, partial [Pseudomonadota bacterium]|nr:4-hydroxyphenylacetate 3-hydroxylase N-terminal domain-containing protein [Pseudomonadota bacterium]